MIHSEPLLSILADLVYVHSNLKLLQKLQSLDYQEADNERERLAVSDSDSSEEEQ